MNHINNVHTLNSTTPANLKNQQAYQALENAYQISNFLKCDIDKNTLVTMINMLEMGCKPQHIAAIVAQIKTRTNIGS